MLRLALLASLAALACGCPSPAAKRPYPDPAVEDLLARIAATRDQVTSFSAETVMDYWMNDERGKGTVLIMGTTGAQVRINALSPAGESVLADLACDGTDYAYVDFAKNCQTSGRCSRDTIAAMFRIALAPDDFVQLAVGATPVVPGATGSVTWDGKARHETLVLTGSDGRTQTIVLDARDGHADVVSSEVKTADGTQEWRIDNTDFTTVTDEAGMARRVPGKSRFRSPGEKADLVVEWKDRTLGGALGPEKFRMEVPAGLATCSSSAGNQAPGPARPPRSLAQGAR
jgi:hypothetical protein